MTDVYGIWKVTDLEGTLMLMNSLMNKERLITGAIIVGLFGGLIGGPISSLVYYDAPAEVRFRLFIIPEIVGFICLGLMVYYGRSRKKSSN